MNRAEIESGIRTALRNHETTKGMVILGMEELVQDIANAVDSEAHFRRRSHTPVPDYPDRVLAHA